MPAQKSKSKTKTQRAELIDFDVDDVGRVSQTVCPFGEGLACNSPGCMVCDEGPRCCAPGDTCYLEDQDVTNWCTGFRGGDFSGAAKGLAHPTHAFADIPSFWERRG